VKKPSTLSANTIMPVNMDDMNDSVAVVEASKVDTPIKTK
jgi:hypothetical protein